MAQSYMTPDYLGYDRQGRPLRGRIDTRSQSDPTVQAGMRGRHLDMKGNVIGGYTAEGEARGMKRGYWRGGTGSPIPESELGTMPVTTVNPNATPIGPRRTWREAANAVPGTIGQEIGTKPNGNGGGLWRWHALNPNAGKFGAERPMEPGEIRDAPLVATKPLGPKLPNAAPAAVEQKQPTPSPTAAPVATSDHWRKRNRMA